MIEIKQLSWHPVSGHFGSSHMAETPIGEPYFIWITNEGVKSAVPSPNRSHAIHGSLNDAKKYCQQDFERRIKECINIDYEQRFCMWLSDQGSQSIEKVGIETIREIFDVMDKDCTLSNTK
ncbi:hypothetical protein [Bacteroides reticulotermitis]|uniref:hypothetical protein n=1 Tax=Bacteroides reticulotermitis TaxID=1133319 RepID=UPI003A8A8101